MSGHHDASPAFHCDLWQRESEPLALLAELGPFVAIKIELARWSFIKRSSSGAMEYFSPLPCPFAYAEVLRTRSGDGEAIDAIVLGAAPAPGTIVCAAVVGVVDVMDGGVCDPKLLVRVHPAQPAPLRNWERRQVKAFFALWLPLKRAVALLRRDSLAIGCRGIFESTATR